MEKKLKLRDISNYWYISLDLQDVGYTLKRLLFTWLKKHYDITYITKYYK